MDKKPAIVIRSNGQLYTGDQNHTECFKKAKLKDEDIETPFNCILGYTESHGIFFSNNSPCNRTIFTTYQEPEPQYEL